MYAPAGTYLRHHRYGLGRVLSWDRGLFPRVHLRFEDGRERVLDVDPRREPERGPTAGMPDPPGSARAGSLLALRDPRRRAQAGVPLADGGALEWARGFDANADPIIFTIGYEGRTLDEILEQLRHHDVQLLVDIREAPASKRHGFAKRELEAAARKAGIDYALKREWGNPRRAKGGCDPRRNLSAAMARYTEHLAPHIVEAAAFLEQVLSRRPAFLCYEAEPFHCHRSRFAALVLPHCHPQPAVYHILPPAA